MSVDNNVNPLDFLDYESEEQVLVDAAFKPDAHIGKLVAKQTYMFWSSIDIFDEIELAKNDMTPEYNFSEIRGVDKLTRVGRDDSWRYFVDDLNVAKKIISEVGRVQGNVKGFIFQWASKVWRLEMPTNSVLNFVSDREISDIFGGDINYTVNIKTYRHKERRILHQFALPFAVQAAALAYGFIDKPTFHVNELLDDETLITQDFYEKFVGTKNTWQDSVTMQRRDALWAALGEDDCLAYDTVNESSKYYVKSEKLRKCLSIFTRNWERHAWARIMLVPDPHEDYDYGIPVILELFRNEKHALEVATEELSKDKQETGEGNPVDDSGLECPEDWKEVPNMWVEELRGQKEEMGEALPSLPKLKKMSSELSCTVDDIRAWWNKV